MESKKFPGKLTFSRGYNVSADFPFTIEVEDESSRIRFLDIEISREAFLEAFIGSHALVPVTLVFRGLENIGKRLELKNIHIDVPENMRSYYEGWDPFIREAVKSFEVDGWKAGEHDLTPFNHHRLNSKEHTYRVSMRRYVDA